MSRQEGKTIVITGAVSGIGKACAVELAKRGHKVTATTRTEGQASQLRQELQSLGLDVKVFRLDILQEADREQIEKLHPDVLINNAAVGESGPLSEIDMDKVRYNLEVNVFSSLKLSQLALRGMIRRGRGTVIFMSSLASKISMPFLGPYSMSKAALTSAAHALRAEIRMLKKDVHVSVIEPGAYHTGFNQKNIAKKYTWMQEGSHYYSLLPKLKEKEEREFSLIELRSTRSIVKQVVKAAEARRPKRRYTAPWWQNAGSYVLMLFGR